MSGMDPKPIRQPTSFVMIGFRASLFVLCLVGVTFLLAAGLRIFRNDSDAVHESAAREFIQNVGHSVIGDIERVVSPATDRGRRLSHSPDVIHALESRYPETLTKLCNEAIRGATEVDAIALFDAKGAIVAINTIYADGTTIDPERIQRVMDREYTQRDIIMKCVDNRSGKEVWEFQTTCDITPALFDSSGLSVAHSVPVVNSSGVQVGVISTRIRFERVTALINGYQIASGSGSLHLVTDVGGFFDEDINAGRRVAPISGMALSAIVTPLARGEASQVTVDRGDQYVGLFRADRISTLDNGGIQVMISVPQNWLLREANMRRLISAGTPAAIGLLTLALTGMIAAFAQSKLRRRELRGLVAELEGFFATTPDLHCMLARNGTILKTNAAWKRLLGHDADQLVGQSVYAHVHSEDRSTMQSAIEDVPGDENVTSFMTRITSRDDSCRHFEWRCRHANNTIYAAARDVTESIRQQRELTSLEERLRLFIEHTPAAVAMFDREMRYMMASQGWYQQYQISNKNIIGRSHYHFFPSIPQRWKDDHRRALSGESLSAERDYFTRPDGSKLWVRWHLRPWYTAEQEIGGVMLFTEVINEQIEYEERLQHSMQKAESASTAKSEFLANMSHEIRTPMTAILGFTENLLDPELSEDDKVGTIDTIRRNGEYLLQIINDILDISKIEAGKLDVESVACSPAKIVKDVHALMSVRAHAANLPLYAEFEGAVPKSIQTDPTRLRQILVNLVGNAIKFTESGSVRMVSRFVDPASSGDVASEPMMQFDIIDTGIGIPTKHLPKLFLPFSQADSSTTRSYGGTGLGLMISKRLANLLRGDVSVKSSPGVGSTFSVRVATGPLDGVPFIEHPLETRFDVPVKTVASGNAQCLLGRRILLAEDSPDSRKLISLILKKCGAIVTDVINGRMAVDACTPESGCGPSFDVVLMDMQMPVMDGYKATKALRNIGYAGPIVALTANAMDGDRQKCIDAGCTEYATKPIDRIKLIDIVIRVMHERGSVALTTTQSDHASTIGGSS